MNDIYAKQILKIFANNPFDFFNHKQIASRVGVHGKGKRQLVLATMLEMAEENILLEDPNARGRYKLNTKYINDDLLPQNYIVGTIDMKQGGKAYVIPIDNGKLKSDNSADAGNNSQLDRQAHHKSILNSQLTEDILIKPGDTNHALHGDKVRVRMFPQRKMHKPEGQVVEILERARTRFVGIIQMTVNPDTGQDRFAFMVSDNRTMTVDIFIPLEDLAGAVNGEKVLVEMTDWPDRMNNPVGRVIKRLGMPGDNNVEMQSILAEYTFPLDFPPEAVREAQQIQPPTEDDYQGRKDFRKVPTFTIDPADAKDFDDALSCRPMKNGNYEVGVHIADVSHYVKPGTALDRAAYERATSVYLVDRTISMLPEELSNGVCSLGPHEDKLCFSVVMEMTPEAKVVKRWFGKTVINSDRRFSYEEAQEVIENGKLGMRNENCLLTLHSLATLLRRQRYDDGAINFETQEVKFILDDNAKPIGVYVKESKEANWLIEEFMLLANRLVAEKVGSPRQTTQNSKLKTQNSTRTFVYRIHDEPNPEKLNTFVEFVTKLGYEMRLGSRKKLADSYNNLFETIAGRGEEHMIDSIAIRTMAKAAYSTHNIGHYGLGFPYYTHFTSPIRRYPDLMVHRLLLRYMDGQPSVSSDEYEEYCQHCSLMERRAAEAERASVKYKQAEYLADKVGQEFPALISGVSKWGFYAEIEGYKCEGMVSIGSLRDDYYMLDEDNYQLIGRHTGKAYKLGMPVTIRVKGVNMLKKMIDFELVEPSPKRSEKKKRQPSKKKAAAPESHPKRKK